MKLIYHHVTVIYDINSLLKLLLLVIWKLLLLLLLKILELNVYEIKLNHTCWLQVL